MTVALETILVPGDGVELEALTADGSNDHSRRPSILFIHENRGLVPYMREVIIEVANAGHHVVAPDLLSRVGGTLAFADDPTRISTRAIDNDIHGGDLVQTYDWMHDRYGSVAILGFCFGAEMGWQLVTQRSPDRAALLYGIGPSPDRVTSISTRIYAAYAENDHRVNNTLEPLCRALSSSTADVTLESFPGTTHAFHDHTRPDRFSADAAARMWEHVLDFLA